MLRIVSESVTDPRWLILFTPVDSQLAKQSSLTAVSEILNGCMSEPFLRESLDALSLSFGRAGAACSSVK